MGLFSSFRRRPAADSAQEEKYVDTQGNDHMGVDDGGEKDDVAHLLMAEEMWREAERAGFFQGEPGLHVVSLRKSKDVYM